MAKRLLDSLKHLFVSRSPLQGCRVVVTRPGERGEDLVAALASQGADVLHAPTTTFESRVMAALPEIEQACQSLLTGQDWLVLPSPTACFFFGQACELLGIRPEQCAAIQGATIGEGSRAQMQQIGIDNIFLSPEANAASLGTALPCEAGERVWIAGALRGRPELPRALEQRNIEHKALVLYETVPYPAGVQWASDAIAEAPGAVVIAAAPSACTALLEGLNQSEVRFDDLQWLCIGETTANALRTCDIPGEKIMLAEDASNESMVQSLTIWWQAKSGRGGTS